MPPDAAADPAPPAFRVINTLDTRDPQDPGGPHYTWAIRHRDQTIYVNAALAGADYIHAVLEAVAALTVGPQQSARRLTLIPNPRDGTEELVS